MPSASCIYGCVGSAIFVAESGQQNSQCSQAAGRANKQSICQDVYDIVAMNSCIMELKVCYFADQCLRASC